MRRAAKSSVDALIRELAPRERKLVRALRALVRKTAPDCVETSVWRAISYHRPAVGGRVKGALCMIEAKRGKVVLSFIHGARLADPARLLRGTARSKRFVDVATSSDATRPALAGLIREAATIEW